MLLIHRQINSKSIKLRWFVRKKLAVRFLIKNDINLEIVKLQI